MTAKRPPARRRAPQRGRTPPRKQPARRRRGVAGNRAFALAFVALLVALGVMSVGPLRTYLAATQRVQLLADTREHLQQEVADLEERKRRLNEPEWIEREAREQHDLKKSGEQSFIVVAPSEDPAEAVGPDAAARAAPGDDPWYRRLQRAVLELFR